MKLNFKDLLKKDIFQFIEGLGHKPYRAEQLIKWVYHKLAVSFDVMSDIPKSLRDDLNSKVNINNLRLLNKQISSDGSRKFLFGLEDGLSIESVLIPGERISGSFTLCISSQAGCAVGCRFCLTGRSGLRRNLKASEIVDQIISSARIISQEVIPDKSASLEEKSPIGYSGISNIVFMGMGEPLNNLDEVIKSLWIITELMGFSKRKITVSTAGIVPAMKKFAKEAPAVNLAISLNATTDESRSSIMPINRKYPLKDLLKTCRDYPLQPNRRITFEYVLLNGINDTDDDALRLLRLLKGIRSKVNLIPYNPSQQDRELSAKKKRIPIKLVRPDDIRIAEFQDILKRGGLTAIIRKSKGADISAACGQLACPHSSVKRQRDLKSLKPTVMSLLLFCFNLFLQLHLF